MKRRVTRREALGMLGATGAALSLVRCGETPTSPSTTAAVSTGATGGTSTAACIVSPSETVGPYPSLTDLFRSDIREGKIGAPLALTITVVNINSACSPVAGANVEIWQCDADGRYSQYAQPGYDGRSETYLRGIQTTDGSGRVTFTTISYGPRRVGSCKGTESPDYTAHDSKPNKTNPAFTRTRRFTLLGSHFSVRVQVRFRVHGSEFGVRMYRGPNREARTRNTERANRT